MRSLIPMPIWGTPQAFDLRFKPPPTVRDSGAASPPKATGSGEDWRPGRLHACGPAFGVLAQPSHLPALRFWPCFCPWRPKASPACPAFGRYQSASLPCLPVWNEILPHPTLSDRQIPALFCEVNIKPTKAPPSPDAFRLL